MGGGEEDHLSFASTRDISFRSSVAPSSSSSFSLATNDDGDRVVHCEVEEIASLRWLPSPLRWRPSPKRGRVDASCSYGSAAESPLPIDWGRLLTSDHLEILRRAVDPVEYSSREQLYPRLCEPILIDEGLKMFWLEKPTGKKCYMLSARATRIWGLDAHCWKWISVPDASFPEVAELQSVWWLEIEASISSREFSPGTRYGAYLVLRPSGQPLSGQEYPLQETFVSVGGALSSTRKVRLLGLHHLVPYQREDLSGQPPNGIHWVYVPRGRKDGWMELEMGDFFIGAGREEVVEVRLKGRRMQEWRDGLIIVHGLEVRPVP